MMKNILEQARTAVIATLVLAVILCGIYPVAVWGVAQLLFSDKANGSLIERDGKVIGSKLIGQNFSAPKYFHTRPSAAGKGYDAANSGGSNLGPISQKHLDAVRDRVAAYRKINNLNSDVKIPVDAVTASASGLDPHISPMNAKLQLIRVAKERALSEDQVGKLIEEHTNLPFLGLLGDPAVNVITLNVALDQHWK